MAKKIASDEEIIRIILLSVFILFALLLMFPNIFKSKVQAKPKSQTTKSGNEKTPEAGEEKK